MPGTEVRISRQGRGILIEPLDAPIKDEATWLAELDALAALSRPDPEGWTVSDLMRSIREDDDR